MESATALPKLRIVCATIKKDSRGVRSGYGARTVAQAISTRAKAVGLRQVRQRSSRSSGTQLYNLYLHSEYRGEIALFVHDDVYLNDWCLGYRLRDAMEHFDVVGIVGNAMISIFVGPRLLA